MRKLILLLSILLITFINVNGQGIGKIAPEKPLIKFPPNAIGLDIVFTNGGIGLGSFYKRAVSEELNIVGSFSISEAKSDNEFTRIDPYTLQTFTYNKKNRIFLVPFTVGMQYRLFRHSLYETLRPYVNAGIGPTMVITDPYSMEFLKAFGKAHNNFALGGYIGFGANFGLDKSNLIGLSIRYYFIHMFNKGVESLYNQYMNNFNGVFLSISLGKMY